MAAILSTQFQFQPGEPTGYYRPVAMLSLWCDSALYGRNPSGFHATNVVLHGVVSGLVSVVGRALTGSPVAALIGGALFAVHPVHVESVAFIAGRTDLWAALFVLLSLLAWLLKRAGVSSPLLPWTVWGALSYALACLSKEVGILLPLAIFGWDAIAPIRGTTGHFPAWWERNRSWVAAYGLSLSVVVVLRWFVAGITPVSIGSPVAGAMLPESGIPAWRLLPGVWSEYLRLLTIPWPLKPYYTPDQVGLSVLTVAGVLAFLSIVLVVSGKEAGRIGIGGSIWIAFFLFPVAGAIPFQWGVVAERFLYIPSIAICIISGGALELIEKRFPPPWRIRILGGALAALCAVGVLAASCPWRTDEALFSRMIETTPGSWIGYLNRGKALGDQGRNAEAVEMYSAAVRIHPGDANTRFNLGVALSALGRGEEAMESVREALRIRPDMAAAHNKMGKELATLGRNEEAIFHYREAVRYSPEFEQAHNNLGVALMDTGRFEDAIAHFQIAIRIRPGYAIPWYNAGILFEITGRGEEAIRCFRETLRLQPDHLGARMRLDQALSRRGR